MNRKLIHLTIIVCLIIIVMPCSASNLFNDDRTYGITGANFVLDENFVVFSTSDFDPETAIVTIDMIIVYTDSSMFDSVEEFENNFESILPGIIELAETQGDEFGIAYKVGIVKATAFINGINRDAHWANMSKYGLSNILKYGKSKNFESFHLQIHNAVF